MKRLLPPASLRPSVEGSRATLLSDYTGAKAATLRDLIAQIELEKRSRERLTLALGGELELSYTWIKDQLLPLQAFPLLWDRSLDLRRSQLEQRLLVVTNERIRVEQEAWRDTAQLTRERRGWAKQYSDLVLRLSFIEDAGRSVR